MIDELIQKKTETLKRLVSGYEEAKKEEATGDFRAAYEALLHAVIPTEATDQYNWGTIYFNGIGVQKDYQLAYDWFLKASENGSPRATGALGGMYHEGLYVEQDREKAFSLFLKAAQEGDVDSQRNVGAMYLNGDWVEKNPTLGFQWVEKAASEGNETCKLWLGQEYYRGNDLERSYEKAWDCLSHFDISWKSNQGAVVDEENNYPHANCLLGMMYLHGKGRKRDDQKALKCLRYAAENGEEEAQFWLGFQYVRGLGVDINIEEGDKWLKESAKNGFEDAVKLQEADHKREFLDEIWAKAKEEAEQDRKKHEQAIKNQ